MINQYLDHSNLSLEILIILIINAVSWFAHLRCSLLRAMEDLLFKLLAIAICEDLLLFFLTRLLRLLCLIILHVFLIDLNNNFDSSFLLLLLEFLNDSISAIALRVHPQDGFSITLLILGFHDCRHLINLATFFLR